MLDVPGATYINGDHYCEQLQQDAVAYQPYREYRPAGVVPPGQPNAGEPTAEVQARPAILPVRAHHAVAANHCLRRYLMDKFLSTFKTQKPKQTCSNYLDEFVINYENYAHQRWTALQLQGNAAARAADMLQLVTDGISKEFKTHCDNIQLDITTFAVLENDVLHWQRSTTTGKAFTAGCVPVSVGANANVNVSAIDMDNPFPEDNAQLALLDSQTSSLQVSSAATRCQIGGRGGRGAGRGGRGGRG